MDWYEKTEGSIGASIGEGGLEPCIVLGACEWDERGLAEPKTAPGFFHVGHQSHGLSCYRPKVYGVVLPLSRCKNKRMAEGLMKIEEIFWGTSDEAVWGPSFTQLREVAEQLSEIGLSCEYTFRRIGEAYIPFDFTEQAYCMFREQFEMVTLLREDGIRCEILETAPLPWKNIRALLDTVFTVPSFLGHAAFLYENSD